MRMQHSRNIMMNFKHTHKDKDHKAHHFVVDSSNEFAVCGICGLRRSRKIIGWDTRGDDYQND